MIAGYFRVQAICFLFMTSNNILNIATFCILIFVEFGHIIYVKVNDRVGSIAVVTIFSCEFDDLVFEVLTNSRFRFENNFYRTWNSNAEWHSWVKNKVCNLGLNAFKCFPKKTMRLRTSQHYKFISLVFRGKIILKIDKVSIAHCSLLIWLMRFVHS